jgi:hypothetical protein
MIQCGVQLLAQNFLRHHFGTSVTSLLCFRWPSAAPRGFRWPCFSWQEPLAGTAGEARRRCQPTDPAAPSQQDQQQPLTESVCKARICRCLRRERAALGPSGRQSRVARQLPLTQGVSRRRRRTGPEHGTLKMSVDSCIMGNGVNLNCTRPGWSVHRYASRAGVRAVLRGRR